MGKGDTIGSHGYFLLSFVKRAAGTMRGDNARGAPRERERRKWLSVSRGARCLGAGRWAGGVRARCSVIRVNGCPVYAALHCRRPRRAQWSAAPYVTVIRPPSARPLVTLHDPVVLLCPAAGINVVISLYLRLFRRLLSSYHLVVYLLLSSIQLGLASLLPRGSSLLCYHDIDIVLSQNYWGVTLIYRGFPILQSLNIQICIFFDSLFCYVIILYCE